MIIFDPVRGKNQSNNTWLSAHKTLDVVLLVITTLHASWFFKQLPWGNYLTLLMLPLFVLVSVDLVSLYRHKRFWVNSVIVPIVLILTIAAINWTLEPSVPGWLMGTVFVTMMRMPQRNAIVLLILFLLSSLAAMRFHWGISPLTIMRTVAPSILTLLLIRIFFAVNLHSLEKLDQTSELLTNALQTISQGICVINKDGRFKLFNERACDLLDLPTEFLESNPLLSEVVQFQANRGDFGPDFSHVEPDARDYVATLGVHVNQSIPSQYLRRDKKGRYIEVQSHVMPSGDIVRTYSDVTQYQTINNELQRLLTEEKEHVERLKQITSDLKQANIRFNTTANSLPGAIYEARQHTDGTTEFIYFSDQMCEIFELDREQLIKNPSLVLTCIHPEEQERLTLANKIAYDHGGPLFIELRIRTPSGKTKWIQLSSAPQDFEDPAHTVWSGYAVDITERISLEAKATELKIANEQNQIIKNLLRDKEELIQSLLIANRTAETGALSAALAHELNQPLCAIGLHTEVLQQKLGETADPETNEILAFIADDNKRASGIINSLRRIFRQEATHSQKIDLNELIKSLQPLYQPHVVAKNIAIDYELCKDGIVEIDSNEFQQVVINLMNNAITSFDGIDGKIKKEIKVQTRRTERTLSFIVSDNGCGIPTDIEPKIFTLLKVSSKSGMGLGLWLSKHIVEQHRGTIRFEHIPTGGTRFIVELPV
ncbi:PAS domain S-box protein [Orrella sp. NBD-18]|uniref:histidine kinase n=1 Tax=Sheuella amnicola TaxID=2707330 RepID=A0A6B2R025_9BURK|nr:ATP-binding protein [Sheuella amnicola]NDY83358.1 PAS domain S-box protein [Sheuella amnicola]